MQKVLKMKRIKWQMGGEGKRGETELAFLPLVTYKGGRERKEE